MITIPEAITHLRLMTSIFQMDPRNKATLEQITKLLESMQWQPVVGWEQKYDVSRSGVIRNKQGVVVTQWKNDQGYMLAKLSNPRKDVRVHRMVAKSHIPNPCSKPDVNHIDHRRDHNHVANLEWCTQKENLAHMTSSGRRASPWKNKRSPNAKLSDDVISQIIQLRIEGLSYQSLASMFNTSKRTIGRILNGEAYSPLPAAPNRSE